MIIILIFIISKQRDIFYLGSKIPHCVRSCIGTRLINVQKVFEREYVMDR